MAVSASADRRIRRFSTVVGVLSTLVAVATIAAVMLPNSSWNTPDEPWEAATIVEAERDGTVWSSSGSALVVLPEELRDRPIQVTRLDDGDDLTVYLGDERDRGTRPFYEGNVWSDGLTLAVYADSELWMVAEGAWAVEIMEIVPPTLETSATGRGDKVFLARGSAGAGTLSWTGEGSLYAVARTVEGYESLGSEYVESPGSRRFVWQDSPFVVIEVRASDDVEWTITLDPAPGAPQPSGTANPTDEGDGS